MIGTKKEHYTHNLDLLFNRKEHCCNTVLLLRITRMLYCITSEQPARYALPSINFNAIHILKRIIYEVWTRN